MDTLDCYETVTDMRMAVRAHKVQDLAIGLVPTMGNLHAGHLQLIEDAKDHCQWVICSIFVNPMQFGPNEDLASYPRTLSQDKILLANVGCDCLFVPSESEMYPTGLQGQTVVAVPDLGSRHCGSSRPGHFDGVTTVVSKLFNICQPDMAFFGLKDYQQFLLIQKVVADLQFPVSLVGVDTVREEDGLAISSRNVYLTTEQRRVAPVLYRTLQATGRELTSGNKEFSTMEEAGRHALQQGGLRPDYYAICNADTLQAAHAEDSDLVVLAAAYLGKARLIDNLLVSL